MKSLANIAGAVIFFFIGYLIFNHIDNTYLSPSPETTQSTSPTTTPLSQPQITEPESTSIATTVILPPEIQLSEAISGEKQSTEYITSSFTWMYQGEWNWELEIPKSLYEYYQELPRPPTMDYSVYVTHPLDDPYIELLVEKIKSAAQNQGYDEYQIVELAIRFVQSLPYTADSVTTPFDEYPRYPIETLVDKGGDCEDTSILLASIIDKLGYGVVLIMLPEHCAVGVKGSDDRQGSYWEYEGNRYFYIETTNVGWGIGELPEDHFNTAAYVFPLDSVPILIHEWTVDGKGFYATLEVTVKNIGTTSASNVSVLAGFDAGDDKVWNSQTSDFFSLGVDQQVKVTFNLRIPIEKHTRILVQIIDNNVAVEESYSEWFDT